MFNCPSCHQATLNQSDDGTRPRPDTFTVMKCSNCGDYALKHQSGRVYPLLDSTDPDSDATTRKM